MAEFDKLDEAIKVKEAINNAEFLGRDLEVDFAFIAPPQSTDKNDNISNYEDDDENVERGNERNTKRSLEGRLGRRERSLSPNR